MSCSTKIELTVTSVQELQKSRVTVKKNVFVVVSTNPPYRFVDADVEEKNCIHMKQMLTLDLPDTVKTISLEVHDSGRKVVGLATLPVSDFQGKPENRLSFVVRDAQGGNVGFIFVTIKNLSINKPVAAKGVRGGWFRWVGSLVRS